MFLIGAEGLGLREMLLLSFQKHYSKLPAPMSNLNILRRASVTAKQ